MEQTIVKTQANTTQAEMIEIVKQSIKDYPINPENMALSLIKEAAALFMWGDPYYQTALKVVAAMTVHFADNRRRHKLPEEAQEQVVEVLGSLHRFLNIIANNVEPFEYYASMHVVENPTDFPEDYQSIKDHYLS